MKEKQKKILRDMIIVLVILFLAVVPVFGGKNGIQILGGMIADDVMDAIEK